MPRKDDGYRINRNIIAQVVRLIDEEGTMVGEISSQEALEIAQNKGLDLIEIAPNAKPPTCKIMDYGKWKYENKKKEHEARKKQTKVTVKEIQLRPRTEEHDLLTKLGHARKFILDGDKVKVNLRFYGREMAHQELGLELLQSIIKRMDDIALVESPPKKEGRRMFLILAPDAPKIKDYNKLQVKAKKAEAAESKAETAEPKAEAAEAKAQTAEPKAEAAESKTEAIADS